eukprot:568821-Prorocentrum_minimum.AAC.1
MQIIRCPTQFDTIVTGNIFGDILSDAAAMLTGSIGMLPSAAVPLEGPGLFEPVRLVTLSLSLRTVEIKYLTLQISFAEIGPTNSRGVLSEASASLSSCGKAPANLGTSTLVPSS